MGYIEITDKGKPSVSSTLTTKVMKLSEPDNFITYTQVFEK